MNKRILSGVQPTGNLHLGNYLGAIRNWVKMQHDYECLFMLADLHAITVPQDPAALRKATRETAAAYIACGIDPEKHIIFPQSAVSMHSELAWILSCHTPLGWLNRMTQFKEKAKLSNREQLIKNLSQAFKILEGLNIHPDRDLVDYQPVILNSIELIESSLKELKEDSKNYEGTKLGLLSYPVLMAADIIGYKATHVPVGEDQKQHLELARDIAGAFNRAYKTEFFPLPEPVILGEATRVMSLNDGTKKMSKSDPSDYSRITLTDDADAIAKKFKKAKSDMEPGITYDPEKRPEATNLLNIYAALTGEPLDKVKTQFAASQFSQFKSALADTAVAHLSPITSKMRELTADTAYLDSILKKGADRANAIAQPIFKQVKEMVGFFSYGP